MSTISYKAVWQIILYIKKCNFCLICIIFCRPNLVYIFSLLLLFSHQIVSNSLWPHETAHQAPLSFTVSWSLPRFMSIESVYVDLGKMKKVQGRKMKMLNHWMTPEQSPLKIEVLSFLWLYIRFSYKLHVVKSHLL